MKIENVFPKSMNVVVDIDAATRSTLWKISELCNELWNIALEQRRNKYSQGKSNAETQRLELLGICKEHPRFNQPAFSVLEQVLYSLEEAYAQYHQALEDYKAKKRADTPAPPQPRDVNLFFPQRYQGDDIHFDQEHTMQLAYDQNWLSIELPAGSYKSVKSVRVNFNASEDQFHLEMNPEE